MFNRNTKRSLNECRAELARLVDVLGGINSVLLSISVDQTGRVLAVNDKFARVLGHNAEELLGAEITSIQLQPKSLFFSNLDGRAQNYIDSKGNTVKLVICWIDMQNDTFQGYGCVIPQYPEEKYNSSEMYCCLEESIAIVQFDPAGRIVYANRVFAEAMGYSLPEMIGQFHVFFGLNNFFGKVSENSQYEAFWSSLNKGLSTSGTVRRTTKSGRVIYFEAVYSPIKDNLGRLEKVIKFARLVTDRVENLQRVKQAIDFAYNLSKNYASEACEGVSLTSDSLIVRQSIVRQMASITDLVANLKSNAKVLSFNLSAIKSISLRVNNLTINAGIQSARADLKRDGFEPVVDEIRSLDCAIETVMRNFEEVIDENNKIINMASIKVECGVDQAAMLLDLSESAAAAMSDVKKNTNKMMLALESASSSLKGLE